jgi:hypothetical protein
MSPTPEEDDTNDTITIKGVCPGAMSSLPLFYSQDFVDRIR